MEPQETVDHVSTEWEELWDSGSGEEWRVWTNEWLKYAQTGGNRIALLQLCGTLPLGKEGCEMATVTWLQMGAL